MGGFWGVSVFPIMFGMVFLLVIGILVWVLVMGITRWRRNNRSPVLTVPATVVAKRENVSHHGAHDSHCHTFTTYYVTFQVQSGDRMELAVDGQEYGVLIEGDTGWLTFQGTRFLQFTRA